MHICKILWDINERFKAQLQKLKNTAMRHADGYYIHKLAAFAANDIILDCQDADLDNAWKEQLAKLSNKSCIRKLPDKASFKATLRQYQIEGYNWLSLMADWKMGVCLADDMGLGKTVQAIVLLLARANDGASLVVAPTSVRYNWINEIKRFAPKLKPYLFAELDREALLKKVSAHDIVICSYGLLQRNVNLLHKVNWGGCDSG
jgi:SNF2 family DNA or RNA helicase